MVNLAKSRVMHTRPDPDARSREGLSAAAEGVTRLLGLPGQLVEVGFRGRGCAVVAEPDPAGLASRPAGYEAPVTDLMHLELASGSGQESVWPRPVRLHVVVEAGRDPLRALTRASRWASYAGRVAVVPAERVDDRVRLEASLRGIWLVSAGERFTLAVAGEHGPVTGAAQGLTHRLFDEVVYAALDTSGVPEVGASRPGALRGVASAAEPWGR